MSKNPKNWGKLMKMADIAIAMADIDIERLEEIQWNF